MSQEKPKSNSVLTSTFDTVKGLITITVIGLKDGAIELDVRKLCGEAAYDALSELGKRMLGHGGTQRLSDRAAIARDKITGQSATPADKYVAIKSLRDHLASGGTWEISGTLPPIQRPHLYNAVATVRGYTAQQVEAVYRDKPDDVLRTLLTIPAIAGKYTELCRAGSAPADDKAKAMFEELDKAVAAETPKAEGPEKRNKGFRSQSN
jgi:hypothetical protein